MLVAALLVARSCGRHETRISKEEAIALATREAGFTPCAEPGCVVVRAVQQGIPPRLVWIVGLAPALGADGKPVRAVSFEVDVETGEVTRR